MGMQYPRVFLEGLQNAGGMSAVEECIDAIERKRGKREADSMRRLWAEMRGEPPAHCATPGGMKNISRFLGGEGRRPGV